MSSSSSHENESSTSGVSGQHYSNDFYSQEANHKKWLAMSNDNNTHPSYFLRLRDLEQLLSKFKPADKRIDELATLDYGCGAGRPLRHLKQIGVKNLIGCDINQSLLDEAKQLDPAGEYVKLELPLNPEDLSNKLLPFENNRFDFVMSCMVILELSSKLALQNMFNESSRVLKPGGLYFLLKCPKHLYSVEDNMKWKFFSQHFPENVNIKSGSAIKLGYLGIEFNIFYWDDRDLIELCASAGLVHVHTHHVIGRDELDGVEWLDENKVPVYLVMVFKKRAD